MDLPVRKASVQPCRVSSAFHCRELRSAVSASIQRLRSAGLIPGRSDDPPPVVEEQVDSGGLQCRYAGQCGYRPGARHREHPELPGRDLVEELADTAGGEVDPPVQQHREQIAAPPSQATYVTCSGSTPTVLASSMGKRWSGHPVRSHHRP